MITSKNQYFLNIHIMSFLLLLVLFAVVNLLRTYLKFNFSYFLLVLVCLFQTYSSTSIFRVLFSHFFLLQIMLCINHRPFFVAFFIFFIAPLTFLYTLFSVFFSRYLGCLIIVSAVLFDMTITSNLFHNHSCPLFFLLDQRFSLYP